MNGYTNGNASERSSRKAFKVIAIVLLIVVFVGGLVGYGAWRGWQAFVRFGMANDLSDYQKVISDSELDAQVKRRLVGRVDLIRERARDKYIGFFRWLSYDESFKAIFGDRRITNDEVLLLERELYRLEKEFE